MKFALWVSKDIVSLLSCGGMKLREKGILYLKGCNLAYEICLM